MEQWVRIGEACRRVRRSQNVVYRLGALGVIRTRRGRDGRLEFAVVDLERLRGRPADTAAAASPAA